MEEQTMSSYISYLNTLVILYMVNTAIVTAIEARTEQLLKANWWITPQCTHCVALIRDQF